VKHVSFTFPFSQQIQTTWVLYFLWQANFLAPSKRILISDDLLIMLSLNNTAQISAPVLRASLPSFPA
jgi:hypothetical protein